MKALEVNETTDKTKGAGKILAATLVLVVGLLAAVMVVMLRSCGELLVELEVGDDRRDATFVVAEGARVGFSAELELDGHARYREDHMGAVDLEISLSRDGQEVALLRCDPFDMFVWTSSRNVELTGLSGRLERCDAQLPGAGRYVVRARTVWRDQARPFSLRRVKLAVRRD